MNMHLAYNIILPAFYIATAYWGLSSQQKIKSKSVIKDNELQRFK
jgi:hypothetical protein